jgi:hypothetical protein
MLPASFDKLYYYSGIFQFVKTEPAVSSDLGEKSDRFSFFPTGRVVYYRRRGEGEIKFSLFSKFVLIFPYLGDIMLMCVPWYCQGTEATLERSPFGGRFMPILG